MVEKLNLGIQDLNGVPCTTSLDVAREFGKRHDHVIRDIEHIKELLVSMLDKTESLDIRNDGGQTPKMGIDTFFIEGTYNDREI